MTAPSALYPMNWPDGEPWLRPELLSLLEGTPVNCLVVSRESVPVMSTWVGPNGRKLTILTREASGLANPAANESPIPIVAATHLPDSTPSGLVVIKALWPQIRNGSSGGQSGPTGEPWVDSNGWAAKLAHAKMPGGAVWIQCEPPQRPRLLQGADYQLAIADSAASGAQWIVSLDKNLQSGLLTGREGALKDWRGMARTMTFFSSQQPHQMQVASRLGVCSGFSGSDAAFDCDLLNLASRRHLPYKILLDRPDRIPDLTGLTAVLYLGKTESNQKLVNALVDFARNGGLAIIPRLESVRNSGDWTPVQGPSGVKLFQSGRGKVALAQPQWADPYQLAADLQILISHRQDLYRVWNASAMGCNLESSADASRARLEIVNFTGRTFGHPVSVELRQPYRKAWLHTPESPAPAELKMESTNGGVEIALPPFPVYAQIELEA